MNVVVIGGTAFIGPPLVSRLAAAGHAVTVFHRGTTNAALPDGVRELLGDRRDLYSYRKQLTSPEPDAVIDMVCMTEHHSRTTLDTFLGQAGRLVVISSGDVYRAFGRLHGSEPGPPDPVPLTEESPLREKLHLYRDQGAEGFEWQRDYEKVMVERVAREDPQLPATVLRLPAVYGPGDYQHRLFGYARRMADDRHAILLDEDVAQWQWSRGYVENVADAIALAAGHDAAQGRIYNVGEPRAFTELEWVQQIGEAAGWSGKIAVIGDGRMSMGINTEQQWVNDTSRIREELGYEEAVGIAEGIRRTVDWELSNSEVPEGGLEHEYEAEDALLAELGGL